MRKPIGLILCLQLSLAGCAMRGSSNPNQRGERLALERGKLSETTDPIARTRSYIIISDLLLSFADDAAREQEQDDFRGLLNEYGRTIRSARETIVLSSQPDRQPPGYIDFEGALRRDVRTLQDLRTKRSEADREAIEAIDQAIQLSSSIREDVEHLVSHSH